MGFASRFFLHYLRCQTGMIVGNRTGGKEQDMEPLYEVEGDTLLVHVPAELDHHSAKLVKEYSDAIIREGKIRNMIFDFSRTTFMDSSGIGMIMGRYRVLRERQGVVAVSGAGPSVHRILEISGLYKLVEIC